MALNIDIPQPETLKPKITIFGVGGAGGNAINNMISSSLEGVEFVAANTDAQALEYSLAENKIQLGEETTRGLGAGSFPDRGRAAAEENIEEIEKYLEGNHMIFIAAGMGGGTGTGAAPVIAKLAKDKNILTVGVITKPFHFEGKYRMQTAENGIEELKQNVDTLIIIPNQNLFRIANESTTFESAFKMADDVLNAGVRGVTDLITMPGLVNLDFADIRTVMTKMGKAMMGTGEAEGENRAIEACEAAISNPLLDDISIRGAKGVLVNMTGGPDMTLFEADMAVNTIRKEVDDNANIIFGSAFDENMKGKIRVSVVATGIDEEEYRKNLLRDNANSQSSSKFRSVDSIFTSSQNNEQEQDSFFDPGKITVPKKEEVVSISAGSYNSETQYQESENPNYGKSDKKDNAKIAEEAISQISFFSEEEERKIQEEQPAKVKDSAKNYGVKKKQKTSGFSLFGFMSGSSDKKEKLSDECEDLASQDQQDQIAKMINDYKGSDGQEEVADHSVYDDKSITNDNVSKEYNDLELNDEGFNDKEDSIENEASQIEIDLDRDPNESIDVDKNEIPEENFNLNDSVNNNQIANDSSSDDLLTVPAFFRRKKG